MVGIDILQISRIEESMRNDKFMRRVYTDAERDYINNCAQPHESAAAIFCAKEAVAKALGTGISEGVAFKDIEILHRQNGKPYTQLAGAAGIKLANLGFSSAEVSLSHCREYATAVCILR